jgi:HSP20 family protein
MNRLLDELSPDRTSESSSVENRFTPALEFSETADAFALKLEIPGMTAEDLAVEVTAQSVTVSGERKAEAVGTRRSEFCYGRFSRRVPLPARVEHRTVTADYSNGILHLHLPKIAAEQPSVVKVKVS